jgi:hypothetical protein
MKAVDGRDTDHKSHFIIWYFFGLWPVAYSGLLLPDNYYGEPNVMSHFVTEIKLDQHQRNYRTGSVIHTNDTCSALCYCPQVTRCFLPKGALKGEDYNPRRREHETDIMQRGQETARISSVQAIGQTPLYRRQSQQHSNKMVNIRQGRGFHSTSSHLLSENI